MPVLDACEGRTIRMRGITRQDQIEEQMDLDDKDRVSEVFA